MALIPTISVTWCPHPLRPASEREVKCVALADGDTVASIIERLGLNQTPLTATLNGTPLNAIGRRAAVVRESDVLVLQQVAGLEASTMAAKLIMYGEMSYGAAMAIGTVLAFAANAAISMAMSAIASSLTKKSTSQGQSASDNAPTTYSIEGGSNAARPYEPLPLVLGEHRVFPDYASRPFAEFVPDPTAIMEVINNTPVYEVQTHPPFDIEDGVPVAPWTAIGGSTGFYAFYGDNAARSYTSSMHGTVTQPHTFVVRIDPETDEQVVATYEDYLVLMAPPPPEPGGGV
jgi:sulfur carrier protein ThiS